MRGQQAQGRGGEAGFHPLQVCFQISNRDGSRQFGSGGRRGGAQISDKIAQGEIGFVAHPADNRDFRSGHRADNTFIVESPQIFDGAAAACQQDDIRFDAG